MYGSSSGFGRRAIEQVATGRGSCPTRPRHWLLGQYSGAPFVSRSFAERIPAEGPFVVVANHESNLDGFVLIAVFTERRLTFLSAAHLFERPAIGRYLRAMGAFPVEEQRANVASFKRALAILGQGGTVAVFPQGGIDRDEIQGGAAYLALKANAALFRCTSRAHGKLSRRTGSCPPWRASRCVSVCPLPAMR